MSTACWGLRSLSRSHRAASQPFVRNANVKRCNRYFAPSRLEGTVLPRERGYSVRSHILDACDASDLLPVVAARIVLCRLWVAGSHSGSLVVPPNVMDLSGGAAHYAVSVRCRSGVGRSSKGTHSSWYIHHQYGEARRC